VDVVTVRASTSPTNAPVVVLPGAGHMSNLERPGEFNDAVRAFCRAHPPF
jgi:pimeloyl-ACP methyl ester carboxylesterase